MLKNIDTGATNELQL